MSQKYVFMRIHNPLYNSTPLPISTFVPTPATPDVPASYAITQSATHGSSSPAVDPANESYFSKQVQTVRVGDRLVQMGDHQFARGPYTSGVPALRGPWKQVLSLVRMGTDSTPAAYLSEFTLWQQHAPWTGDRSIDGFYTNVTWSATQISPLSDTQFLVFGIQNASSRNATAVGYPSPADTGYFQWQTTVSVGTVSGSSISLGPRNTLYTSADYYAEGISNYSDVTPGDLNFPGVDNAVRLSDSRVAIQQKYSIAPNTGNPYAGNAADYLFIANVSGTTVTANSPFHSSPAVVPRAAGYAHLMASTSDGNIIVMRPSDTVLMNQSGTILDSIPDIFDISSAYPHPLMPIGFDRFVEAQSGQIPDLRVINAASGALTDTRYTITPRYNLVGVFADKYLGMVNSTSPTTMYVYDMEGVPGAEPVYVGSILLGDGTKRGSEGFTVWTVPGTSPYAVHSNGRTVTIFHFTDPSFLSGDFAHYAVFDTTFDIVFDPGSTGGGGGGGPVIIPRASVQGTLTDVRVVQKDIEHVRTSA